MTRLTSSDVNALLPFTLSESTFPKLTAVALMITNMYQQAHEIRNMYRKQHGYAVVEYSATEPDTAYLFGCLAIKMKNWIMNSNRKIQHPEWTQDMPMIQYTPEEKIDMCGDIDPDTDAQFVVKVFT